MQFTEVFSLIGKPGGKSISLNLIDILFRAHSDGDHGSRVIEREGTNADEEHANFCRQSFCLKLKIE